MRTSIFFLFALLPITVSSQVVLTEVMFDPLGPEDTDEFIEILNLQQEETVNLAGWCIGDGTGVDPLIDAGKGLFLRSNQYAVILDPDYFMHSTTYNSLIPAEALILTVIGNTLGSNGLSNSKSEMITLINDLGQIVCQYPYSVGNKPGFSDEKINVTGADLVSNWSDSKILLGTPGWKNSNGSSIYADQAILQIKPNPFFPNTNGYENEMLISYCLPNMETYNTLRIFDSCGRLVRNLIPVNQTRTESHVIWDGRDNSKQKTKTGIYIIVLEGLDFLTGKTVVAKTTVVLVSEQ